MPVVLFPSPDDYGSGDPDISLVGSGNAVPRGIESVLQFNGLTINDLTVIDKYRLIDIDGLDDADIRDAREEKPADDGEVAFEAFYGGRTIVLTGRIEAYELNKMRDMQEAFRTAFADLNSEFPLYFKTGTSSKDHFIRCKKNQKLTWSDEQKYLNHFFRSFQVSLRATNPRFMRNHLKEYTLYPNYIPNSSFETVLTGWTGASNSGNWATTTALNVNASWAAHGSNSAHLKLTKAANTTASEYLVYTPTGTSGFIALPSIDYTAKTRVNVINAPNTSLKFEILFWDSGGSFISVFSDTTAVTGVQDLLVNATSPSNAAYVSVRFSINSSQSSDVFEAYFDDVWLVQGETDAPGQVAISNAGNYSAQPVITVFGGLSNISIENLANDETIDFVNATAIVDGDYYTIDVAANTMVDSVGVNKFKDLSATSDWMRIAPGENTLKVQSNDTLATSVNSKIIVTLRDSWI